MWACAVLNCTSQGVDWLSDRRWYSCSLGFAIASLSIVSTKLFLSIDRLNGLESLLFWLTGFSVLLWSRYRASFAVVNTGIKYTGNRSRNHEASRPRGIWILLVWGAYRHRYVCTGGCVCARVEKRDEMRGGCRGRLLQLMLETIHAYLKSSSSCLHGAPKDHTIWYVNRTSRLSSWFHHAQTRSSAMQNPLLLKSIPGIWHVHVLSRPWQCPKWRSATEREHNTSLILHSSV